MMGFSSTTDEFSLSYVYEGTLVSVGHSKCRPSIEDPGHQCTSRDYLIAIPRSGLFIKHRGPVTAFADPNHAVLFNPGETFRFSHPGCVGDDCVVFRLAPRLVRDVVSMWDPLAADRPDRLFSFDVVGVEPRAFLLQRLAYERAVRGTDDSAIAIEEAVVRLLGEIVQTAYTEKGQRPAGALAGAAREHARCVARVKAFMAQQFRERLTLNEISEEAEVSPFHLCRMFKKETGLSIHRYLNRLRLRACVDSLTQAQQGLTDLAISVGYSSHSHFTEAFRREFGVPPSVVRKAMLETSRDELNLLLKGQLHSMAAG
jgi:AraC-like DNA-binding protein